MNKKYPKLYFVLVLVVVMTIATPVFAKPSDSSELVAARKKLTALQNESLKSAKNLSETIYTIEALDKEISDNKVILKEKQERVVENRSKLSDSMHSDYKSGNVNFFTILFASSSYEELVNHVYYLNSIHKNYVGTIDLINKDEKEIKETLTKLNEDKAQLEKLKSSEVSAKKSYDSQIAKQEKYINSLSEEVREQLKQEEKEKVENQQNEVVNINKDVGNSKNSKNEKPIPNNSYNDSSNSNNSSGSGKVEMPNNMPSSEADKRKVIVKAALSQIGLPYKINGYSPGVGFSCSGLSKYAYACAGIDIPFGSYQQAHYLKKTSNPKPGDLLFWLGGMNQLSGNHVAIYIGNGKMVEAANYMEINNVSSSRPYDWAGTMF